MRKQWKQCQTVFWGGGGSKITTDVDCSHEIKRHLFLGRKVMTNLDSTLKPETLLCQQKSFQSVQFSSVTQSCPTLCEPMNCSTPGLPVHHHLPEFTRTRVPIESVMPSSHLILCRPLFLLPPIPPSIRVFSNDSTLLIRWPKYWGFSFSTIPSKEIPGLISFRMDWLDLLAVQGTLKSLFQHHTSKASIFRCSAFFTVPLSHPYMTTGKIIALTRRTLVGKVMSLLFNIPSRLVITFLPRSKRLLISWLQSPSAVILESPKNSLTLHSSGISTLIPLFPSSVQHSLLIRGRCAKGGVYSEIVSQPFLPASLWFLSGLPHVKGLLCQFLGFFRGNYSKNSCR